MKPSSVALLTKVYLLNVKVSGVCVGTFKVKNTFSSCSVSVSAAQAYIPRAQFGIYVTWPTWEAQLPGQPYQPLASTSVSALSLLKPIPVGQSSCCPWSGLEGQLLPHLPLSTFLCLLQASVSLDPLPSAIQSKAGGDIHKAIGQEGKEPRGFHTRPAMGHALAEAVPCHSQAHARPGN